MSWRNVDVQEQRVRFVVLAERKEKNMRQLCQEFEISPTTGYKWLKRFRAEGVGGMRERSRRPASSRPVCCGASSPQLAANRNHSSSMTARPECLLARPNHRFPENGGQRGKSVRS